MIRTLIIAADTEGSEIESRDLAAQTAANPHHIEGDHQSIRRQSANTVHTREVEEEIGIQRAIKDPGVVIREIETKDVIVPERADHILQTVQEEKLDPHPERSHEALLAVHSRINRKLIQKRVKSYR